MRDIGRISLLLFAAAVALARATTGHTAPANTTPKPPAFVSVSAGKDHTCGITAEGLAYCWGSNQSGQLGNDSTTEGCDLGRDRVPCSASPVPVLGGLTFRTISAGWNHTCGVATSGMAYCWGGDSTKPTAVAGGLTFKLLSAGNAYTCGVTTDRQAYCWGSTLDGKLGDGTQGLLNQPSPVPVAGGLTFQSVAASWQHTCGVTTGGAAHCWGSNMFGAIGNGSSDRKSYTRPVPVAGGLTFQSVSVGAYYTCGITTTGSAYCWGPNRHGKLGNGSANDSTVPVLVAGGLKFRTISAHWDHVCGVTASGVVYCWGANPLGQLGTSAKIDFCADGPRRSPCSRAPVPVAAALVGASTGQPLPTSLVSKPAPFVVVSSGGTHTCGITEQRTAYCWGSNRGSQLGSDLTPENCDLGGQKTPCSTSPVRVSGGLTFRSISAGWSHTCGLTTGGQAYCWGSNSDGQLGNGFSRTISTKPGSVAGALAFKELSAGHEHTCAVTTEGKAYCWGGNVSGQLGNGTRSRDPTSSPVRVSGGLTFKSVSTGQKHTCGLTTGSQAYCWGYNGFGALGSGSLDNELHTTPVPVSGGLTFQSLSAGTDHTCGITANGVAYCWGNNGQGQLGNGGTANRAKPVPVSSGLTFRSVSGGASHTCGITTGGAVYCWGYNAFGTLGVPSTPISSKPVPVSSGLTFRSVSGGASHTCGVTTGGAVYCWGSNLFGRLGATSPMETCGYGSEPSPCSTTPVRVSDPRCRGLTAIRRPRTSRKNRAGLVGELAVIH